MPDAATDSSSGDFTLTKAPKTDLPSTMPSSHSSVPAKGINFERFTGSAGLGNPATEASLSMLNANLPFSASTLNTRTRTSLPRGAAWATSAMKASAMYLMGTKPLASSWPPPGGFTATKTPYKVELTTRPVSHSSGKPAMSSNGESSALNCADSSGWSSFFFLHGQGQAAVFDRKHTHPHSLADGKCSLWGAIEAGLDLGLVHQALQLFDAARRTQRHENAVVRHALDGGVEPSISTCQRLEHHHVSSARLRRFRAWRSGLHQ
mmetsp:Transcript_99718/g.321262  ORF Transcript_99718/g.321262 Transcript_99718/m.321262 type:complete len:264 (-) Transcript_99718:55-846(-)